MAGLLVLLQGIVLGFVVAAPVGPIGLLCVRRTLEHGPGLGFATGLGAAVADTVWGAVAAFSISAVIVFITGYEMQFRLFGGIFMLAVAWRAFRTKLGPAAEAPDSRTFIGAFATGLVLTLTNPITILAFIALLAGFGLGGHLGQLDAATIVVGVFIGSASWWIMLAGGIALVRHKIDEPLLLLINRAAAVGLAGFGGWATVTAVGSMMVS